MATYALKDTNNTIVNIIVLDDPASWQAPAGQSLIPDQGYDIGGLLVGGVYTPPQRPSAPPISQPLVPQSVTPRQARLALLGAGLLDKVTAAVTAIGGPTLITWEYASAFDRQDPLILQLGSSLNMTPAQIDQLFVTASTL